MDCSSCHQHLLNHILAKLGGNSLYSCKRTKMLFSDSAHPKIEVARQNENFDSALATLFLVPCMFW